MPVQVPASPYLLTPAIGQESLYDQLMGLPLGPNNPLTVNASYLFPPYWSPGPNVLPGAPLPLIQNAVGTGAAIGYQIVSVNILGQDSVPGPVLTASNNAATANNTLAWLPVPGAVAYRIIKNGNVLASVTAGNVNANFPNFPGLTYNDNAGSSGNTYTSSGSNPVAYLPSGAVAIESNKATFRVACTRQAMISVTGDFFSIAGVAGLQLRVRRFSMAIAATAAIAALADINLFIRTAAYTGGTASALTPALFDQTNVNPVSSGVVANVYSTGTAPTPGAGTVMDSQPYFIPAVSGTTVPAVLAFDFGTRNDQPPVVRGTTQIFAANISGTAAGAGAVLWAECEFTLEYN